MDKRRSRHCHSRQRHFYHACGPLLESAHATARRRQVEHRRTKVCRYSRNRIGAHRGRALVVAKPNSIVTEPAVTEVIGIEHIYIAVSDLASDGRWEVCAREGSRRENRMPTTFPRGPVLLFALDLLFHG